MGFARIRTIDRPANQEISRSFVATGLGKVEVPYKPVLRIAMPVFSREREPRGIIVMNIAMRHIFNAVDADPSLAAGASPDILA